MTGWYVNRLNRLLAYLYHPATFATPADGSWTMNATKHRVNLLTFIQLTNLLSRILGSEDYYTKKAMSLSLVDLVAQLMGKSIGDLFEQRQIRRIVETLEDLPSLLRTEYMEYALSVFENVIVEAYDGLAPAYRQGDGVVIDGETMRKDKYAGQYMRALRNTIHGYSKLTDRQYERYLAINQDYLPDALADVGPVLFLSLLCEPRLYFRSEALGATW